jgi:hypothetical protein
MAGDGISWLVLTIPWALESDDGEFGIVRFSCQQPLVCADQHYPLSKQGGFVQSEARSEPAVELLSRLFRWKRCQPCRQVSPLAIQSGQSCPPQPLPSVCHPVSTFTPMRPLRLIPKAASHKQQTLLIYDSCLQPSRRLYYKTP